MSVQNGDKIALAHSPAQSKKPSLVEPKFPALLILPTTPEQLFRTTALTVSAEVSQPDPKGKKGPKKQDYTLPWQGYTSWKDARTRLNHFEAKSKAAITWAPFNDSTTNDGPMSLNAYPGRAFIERVTNAGDANLELKAASEKGPMPASPGEAAAKWFGMTSGALVDGLSNDQVEDLARKTVSIKGFVGDTKDSKDCVIDAWDGGIGLTGEEMPKTILSLNRGNKKSKKYLTGKHGQGASSTYQYSDLTLIASRKVGSDKVAFTFVEAAWDEEVGGTVAKTPTYRYLTIDGKVPEIKIGLDEFPVGTLVRHIGYSAADLLNPFGQNSLYGLLMRSLAQPLLPVWLEIFSLRPTTKGHGGYPTGVGYRRYGRVIRGTVNALERAWKKTLAAKDSALAVTEAPAPLQAEEEVEQSTEPDVEGEEQNAEEAAAEAKGDDDANNKMLHRASEYYQLPDWDYGGRTGIAPLGRVRINYWVADPKGRPANDVLRNWVDPNKTIVLTLDGQTHAEEGRGIVTSQQGAKLWAVGRYMVVQIDCNDLDPRAKYELFTSTREHAKETPIKKMILDELVRRLSFDKKLEELNVKLAAADVKTDADPEAISSMIKKYLKSAGINFDSFTKKVDKWVEVDEIKTVPAAKPELPPIEAVEPPTFVRWKFQGTTVSLWPGQRYSFVFETDAAASYWKPDDPAGSPIKVLAHGVNYVGAGEMKGGRVRCHFQCPSDAQVGNKGFIQVQLEFAIGAAKTHRFLVEVVAKQPPKPAPPKKPEDKIDEPGAAKKEITIKVKKKDFTEVQIPVMKPQPVTRADSAWTTLAWPHDPSRVGFSIRTLGGKVMLYYNAEFPPFLDLKNRMSKKSLETEFVTRYEMKLVLHTIFTLNYDFVDEEEFGEEQRRRVRDLLCATAESLALATKSEIEIESKLKADDALPMGTDVSPEAQAA